MKMNKIIISLALLFFIALMSVTRVEASSFKQVKVVSGSSLVVKNQMSTSAKTMATLQRGEFVVVTDASDGWATVEVKGVKGYVNADFLSTPKSVIKIASSKGGLVVKASPSKSAKTLATLQYNMIVEDFGNIGAGWSYVQYGNVVGYVASSFISPPKATTKIVGYYSGDVTLRNIASWSGEETASLKQGTQVSVYATLAGWSYVTAGNKKGYVPATLLQNKPALASKTLNATTLIPTNKRLQATYKTSDGIYETYYYGGKYAEDPRYILMAQELNGAFGNLYGVVNNQFVWGVASSDAGVSYQLPIVEGKTTKIYGMMYPQTAYVSSTTATVEVPAGVFYNVTILKYDGFSFYFAPGVGILKVSEGNRTTYELTNLGLY